MERLNSQARVNEIGDAANQLVTLYKKQTSLQEDVFLKNTFQEMEAQATQLTEAVRRDNVFSELDKVNKTRSEAIKTLAKLLAGYEVIPLENLKPHGIRLAQVFKKYGTKIIYENYSALSNLIDSLLLDLSASALANDISALLGVREAISELRTAEDTFKNVRSQYQDALLEKEKSLSATQLRKPLLEVINKKLAKYLEAMQMADKEKYGNFITSASLITEHINQNILRRKKAPAKAEESTKKD